MEKQCRAQSCARSADRSDNGRVGYCSMHYQRMNKYGDPSVTKSAPRPALDWIEKHISHRRSECLIWPFHRGADGYGRIHDPDKGSLLTTASRYMLLQAAGEPPTQRHECAHSCGKGSEGCVNPHHLYWATPEENHADKIKHGTTNRGERQGQSKLTTPQVLLIRRLVKSNSQSAVARRFGVHPSTINNIVSGKRWGWLD